MDWIQLANDGVCMMGSVYISNEPFGYILAENVLSS
jgi:hypothetical protein